MFIPASETARVFDAFAEDCHGAATAKGFYDEEDDIIATLRDHAPHLVDRARVDIALSKHALINSEVGEASEAVRKPKVSEKLARGPIQPMDGERPFTEEEEEMADAVIRIGDYAGRHELRLGAAIVAKMAYNRNRPHMHGKKA